MTGQQRKYIITEDELTKIEHGCIYPESTDCIGGSCPYYDPDSLCKIDTTHDVADEVRTHPSDVGALATLLDVQAWGVKFGRDAIPGYVDACISTLQRQEKERQREETVNTLGIP